MTAQHQAPEPVAAYPRPPALVASTEHVRVEALGQLLVDTRRSLRVLTTVYLGATDRRALDWLVAHGAEVRVSYDTRRTRLHAKAWLFHRPGLSGSTPSYTAYIGSSNLSTAALHDGLEWNVRLSAHDNEGILAKFQAAF